ncbi:MAG: hypothetical protein IAG13_33680, partial [Deltaproteobacteria bacterium]|nr:hypothetical protein [Nannocystaceae bacterium]
QGHFDRARAVLETCLARDPQDGHALVLWQRLAARSDATVVLTLHADRLITKWTGVAAAQRCSVVLVAIAPVGGTATQWVSSMRCDTPFGRWECPLPFARGSASVCIGRVDASGWSVDAVARPLSWP